MTNSIGLDIGKLSDIKLAQTNAGFRSIIDWAYRAYVSESTLKRFLAGIRITAQNFISICKAVEIYDWRAFVDWNDNDSSLAFSLRERYSKFDASDASTIVESDSQKIIGSLVLNGSLTDDNKPVVEAIIGQLKSVVIDLNVEILSLHQEKNKNLLLMSGDFVDSGRLRIKAFIKHLESFLLEPNVTLLESQT